MYSTNAYRCVVRTMCMYMRKYNNILPNAPIRSYTMKLAVIAPPEFLNEVHHARLSYHMALGQELIRNVAYCDWYRWRHVRGDFIIVDNGAAEPGDERIPFEAVLEAAEYVRADEVILPDVLYDGHQTVAFTTDPNAYNQVPVRSRIIVPQGRSLEEWIECFEAITKRIQYRTIGVAKHLEVSIEGGRPAVLRWLRRQNWTDLVDVHLLGIWADPLKEIERASQAWSGIRGIDTAAPIAYAQHGMFIDAIGHYSLDWVEDADRKLVQNNIKTLLNACSLGETKYASKSI